MPHFCNNRETSCEWNAALVYPRVWMGIQPRAASLLRRKTRIHFAKAGETYGKPRKAMPAVGMTVWQTRREIEVVTNPALQGRCSSRGGRAPKVQAWDPMYTVRQPSRHMRERFRSVFHSLSARCRPTPINGKNLIVCSQERRCRIAMELTFFRNRSRRHSRSRN